MRGAGARLYCNSVSITQITFPSGDHDVGEVLRRDVEGAVGAGTCLYDRDSVPEVPPLGDRHHPRAARGRRGG